MQERYEIRGKIGQGGLGSVYRAFDRNLNREVAIKRILSADSEQQTEEAARQMTQETGALAALQHPNIVTIYDVGTDDDGPFVVMELLKGDTLDAIVEKAPLTESDFLEFARQVQEGLIAAQDLGIVHRDLKPSNVMLNWLPSGKFQVKLVDFGLAKFSPKPSHQTIDQNDSVYGSIFFMAPEQFERSMLDGRTDMYAIGCVYYFALAGKSPFDGDTGPQVMAAHLEHRVKPLDQIRPDVSPWIVDWIMWHINRQPSDRPEDAREALASFIELEGSKTTVMPALPPEPKRPKLLIPGSVPEAPPARETASVPPTPPATQTMPQPLQPPSNSPPSLHTTSHQRLSSPAEASPDAPPPAPVARPATPALATPVPTSQAPPTHTTISPPVVSLSPRKKGMSAAGKSVLTLVLLILVAAIGTAIVQRMKTNSLNERFNKLVEVAGDENQNSLPVSKEELEILLDSTRLGVNSQRETVYRALAIAEPKDGTEISQRIAEFALEETLPSDVRSDLLGRVLVARKDPSVVPELTSYLRSDGEESVSIAALKAISGVGDDKNIQPILNLIATTSSEQLRLAAENAAAAIIDKSGNKSMLAVFIDEALQKASSDDARRALIRLFGHAGGPRAEGYVRKIMEGDNQLDKLAAVEAMADWPTNSLFETLVEYFASQTDDNIRRKAFDAAYRFVTRNVERPEDERQAQWALLNDNAIKASEKLSIIRGLARDEASAWALAIVENHAKTSEQDEVIDLAEKAVTRIREKIKIKESQ